MRFEIGMEIRIKDLGSVINDDVIKKLLATGLKKRFSRRLPEKGKTYKIVSEIRTRLNGILYAIESCDAKKKVYVVSGRSITTTGYFKNKMKEFKVKRENG